MMIGKAMHPACREFGFMAWASYLGAWSVPHGKVAKLPFGTHSSTHRKT